MDDSDEDVEPPMGPVADLMAEHNLSSTVAFEKAKNIETIDLPNEKLQILDYLSACNIRILFKDIFNYILDRYWYSLDQRSISSTLKKILTLFIIYAIATLPLPLTFHLLPLVYICFILLMDLILPMLIHYNWFQCLETLRLFIQTIEYHQQWLIKIHGFQLIRPTSSLFENQLYQLRRTIFEELRNQFRFTRQIARQYSQENDHLICYIDLEEFGPLIQTTDSTELEQITNQFDQISINSMFKLSHLQINECIQLINLSRPKSFCLFRNYQSHLQKSIEHLDKIKKNCSIITDYLTIDKSRNSKLTSSFFLLRSNCEQLFDMNEKNTINSEQLKRIIQDLKTVLYSLEAIQSKPTNECKQTDNEQILSNENSSTNISSYHRYDDQIEELVDEILIGETGNFNEDLSNNNHSNLEIEDYDKKILREQTNCLMKELQTAIQGKKQEWNEREQRLLGHVQSMPIEEEIKPVKEEQPFERIVLPMQSPRSMLDELKHSFALNRERLNINEDTFGEEDDDDDDDDDVEEEDED